MTSRLRSASVGATPRHKPLGRSRAVSSQSAYLEVRCGCQYFQTDNLLSDQVNPLGPRPISPVAVVLNTYSPYSTSSSKQDNLDEGATTDSLLSFGIVTTTDYYAETSSLSLSRPTSPYRDHSRSGTLNSHPYEFHPISQPEKSKSGYLDATEQEVTETFLERGRKRTLSNSVRPIPTKPSELKNSVEEFNVLAQVNSGLLRERSRERSRGRSSEIFPSYEAPPLEARDSEINSYGPPQQKLPKLNPSEIPQIAISPTTLQMDTSDPAILSAHLQKFKSFAAPPPKRSLSEVRAPKNLPPLDPSNPEILSAHLQKFKSRAQSEVRTSSTVPASDPIPAGILKDKTNPEVLSAHLQKFKHFNDREKIQGEVETPQKDSKLVDTKDPEVLSSKLQKFKYFKERAQSEQRTSDSDAKNLESTTLPRSRQHEQRTKHHHSFTSPGKPLTLDMRSLVTTKPQEPIEVEKQPIVVPKPSVSTVEKKPAEKIETKPMVAEIKPPLIAEIKHVPALETKSIAIVETKPLKKQEEKSMINEASKQFHQIFTTPTPVPPVKPPRESKSTPMKAEEKPPELPPKTATPGKSFFKGLKSFVTPKAEAEHEEELKKDEEVKKVAEVKPKEQESFVSDAIMMDHYNLSVSHPPKMRPKLTPQTSDATEQKVIEKPIFSSQRSLDKYSTSTLLQRYRPKSYSQAPSHHGSSGDVQNLPKISKTVSFDYGKPLKMENGKMQMPTKAGNYIDDQYHRMSPMVFPVQDTVDKMERINNVR